MNFNENNFLNYIKQKFFTGSKLPYYQLNQNHLKSLAVLPTRLHLLEKLPKNGIVAEIGIAKGGFSEKILNITQPKKLHLIDSLEWKYFDKKAKSFLLKKFAEQIKTDTIEVHLGKSTYVLKNFSDKLFDWVYLDTDHTYKTTMLELELCKEKIKKGGIIAGHDYTTKNYHKNYSYGVVEAVNEFCYKNNWEFIYLTHETHRHLSYALREI